MHSFPFTAVAPTYYCWQTSEVHVSVGIGEMHVEFMVSINQTGSTFPSNSSDQCATFKFTRQNRTGKLEVVTNVCVTVT